MRIIAGRYKGRKLYSWNKKLPVRPMTDRIKETVFNVLSPYFFESCKVLDLFSGTGSLSLEAFSRGAGEVHAVEKHPLCLQVIKKNTAFLDPAQKFVLHKKNVFSFLRRRQTPDPENYLKNLESAQQPSINQQLSTKKHSEKTEPFITLPGNLKTKSFTKQMNKPDLNVNTQDLKKILISSCPEPVEPSNSGKNKMPGKGKKPSAFDIILIDPPFAAKAGNQIMSLLTQSNLIDKETVIMIETGQKDSLKKTYADFHLFSIKSFKDKGVWFYKTDG